MRVSIRKIGGVWVAYVNRFNNKPIVIVSDTWENSMRNTGIAILEVMAAESALLSQAESRTKLVQ